MITHYLGGIIKSRVEPNMETTINFPGGNRRKVPCGPVPPRDGAFDNEEEIM